MKHNSILSKPPRSAHRLQDTRHFRRLFGRGPRDSDYEGVHTTSNRLIAAAYAMGTWDGDRDAYPVIVTLDVSGLNALPDVDAMLRGAEAVDETLPVYRSLAHERGWTIDDAIEDDDYREAEAHVGEPPAAFIFEDVGYHVANAIDEYAAAEDLSRDKVFASFLKDGTLPPGVLTRMVEQQRYLHDFDIDRVVSIEAIKPWWHRVLAGRDDDEEDAEIARVEERGFHVFTLDDWPFRDEGPVRTVWASRNAERERVEFHGTSSAKINLAFPGLVPEETPFPVE